MVKEVFQLIEGGFVMGEDSFNDNFGVLGGLGFEVFTASVQRGFGEEKTISIIDFAADTDILDRFEVFSDDCEGFGG